VLDIRTDRATGRNEHSEVFVDAKATAGMCAAAGRFTDDGRALKIF